MRNAPEILEFRFGIFDRGVSGGGSGFNRERTRAGVSASNPSSARGSRPPGTGRRSRGGDQSTRRSDSSPFCETSAKMLRASDHVATAMPFRSAIEGAVAAAGSVPALVT